MSRIRKGKIKTDKLLVPMRALHKAAVVINLAGIKLTTAGITMMPPL